MAQILATVVIIILLLWVYIRWLENKTLYFPTREMEQDPDDFGLKYEDTFITTGDGVNIHGWYFPSSEANGVILFFHGNGENISHRIDFAEFFLSRGYEVFLLSYRGYGRSEGKPSEKGLYDDARAAYEYLLNEKSKEPNDIILYGFSLGGAVAIDLASKVDVSLLIVESSFTSAVDMGKRLYPHLPVSRIMRQRYESIHKIDRINVPIMIIHSPEDEIVPFEHGEKLYEKAPEPKAFLETLGNHGETLHLTDEKYLKVLMDFIKRHRQQE